MKFILARDQHRFPTNLPLAPRYEGNISALSMKGEIELLYMGFIACEEYSLYFSHYEFASIRLCNVHTYIQLVVGHH